LLNGIKLEKIKAELSGETDKTTQDNFNNTKSMPTINMMYKNNQTCFNSEEIVKILLQPATSNQLQKVDFVRLLLKVFNF